MKYEIRQFRPEVRTGEDGKPSAIVGTPIVFNSLSSPLNVGAKSFRERITPGAVMFSEDLKADFGHDSKYILGNRAKGTVEVSENESGVSMAATPPDTQWARDLMVSIQRGDIDGGSFRFRVLPGGDSWTREGGENIRTLNKIVVDRVTVTSDPAYPNTDVQVRSAAEVAAEIPDQESAGQAAPPAQRGGVGLDLLRRKQELLEREAQQ